MKSYSLITFFLFLFAFSTAQSVKICTWNLYDFGKSKTDTEIVLIAKTIKDFDIVVIQEVVAKDHGGAQAVGRLGDALNQSGAKWEYRVSDPTSGENSYKRERYAYFWKPSKVKLIGKPWLEKKYSNEINREPFLATFKLLEKEFTLVNFHAITKNMQPETEVKYFRYFPEQYANLNLIFAGDFNLPQSHSVFNPLKYMGYESVLVNQKTSLRQSCFDGDCLASEFDNIFYNNTSINFINGSVIHFYKSFQNFSDARSVSDHLPVCFEFGLR